MQQIIRNCELHYVPGSSQLSIIKQAINKTSPSKGRCKFNSTNRDCVRLTKMVDCYHLIVPPDDLERPCVINFYGSFVTSPYIDRWCLLPGLGPSDLRARVPSHSPGHGPEIVQSTMSLANCTWNGTCTAISSTDPSTISPQVRASPSQMSNPDCLLMVASCSQLAQGVPTEDSRLWTKSTRRALRHTFCGCRP